MLPDAQKGDNFNVQIDDYAIKNLTLWQGSNSFPFGGGGGVLACYLRHSVNISFKSYKNTLKVRSVVPDIFSI